MGPFKLADFIGIDICLSTINVLYNKFDDPKYRPSQLLKTMDEARKLDSNPVKDSINMDITNDDIRERKVVIKRVMKPKTTIAGIRK